MTINLDIYQTAAVAVFVYAVGRFLKKKIPFFDKYCIPSAVIGGIFIRRPDACLKPDQYSNDRYRYDFAGNFHDPVLHQCWLYR